MDADIATLAASAATTLVTAMTSDAWTAVRDRFSQLFATSASAQPEVVGHELELARRRVLDLPLGAREQAFRDIEEGWAKRLEDAVDKSFDRGELENTVDELSQLVVNFGSSTTITIEGTATGQSRIYQQGQGIQHNG